MTDPKLVEKATDLFKRLDRIAPFPGIMIPIITKDLQSYGEEVRRRTIEECAKVASEFAPKPIEETYFSEREHDFIRNKVECVVIAIRKLLEVKGA